MDNSEWMRNGDYAPTRQGAQYDMTSMLIGAKLRVNHESTVGVLTMAGPGINVLTSPTNDQSQLYSGLHGIPLASKCNFVAGLKVAMLALKHREKKQGSQRIILIVGSPLLLEEKNLIKVGKSLRKNNVALDIIAMGENLANEEKLQKLVEAANKDDNSRIISVPAGTHPSDVVRQSAIINTTGGGGASGGGGGANFAEFGGVDPSLDPELAMALQASMAQLREDATGSSTGDSGNSSGGTGEGSGGASSTPASNTAPPAPSTAGMSAEEIMLQQALAMSMGGIGGEDATSMEVDDDEDEDAAALAAALAMSSGGGDSSGDSGGGGGSGADFSDPAFTASLLSGLPGVDPNDPSIQAAMGQGSGGGDTSGGQFEDPDFINSLLSGLPGVDPNDPSIQAALKEEESDDKDKKDKK
jgi:26S proteasome regulatory subunit N10